jgi:type VI secretion system protein ImpL
MKKRTRTALIFWIILAVVAIAVAICGSLLGFVLIGWLTATVIWLGTGVWIGLHFLLGRAKKIKGGATFVGSQAVFNRIDRDCKQAVERYLGSVQRTGLFKKNALYERPWFLLCGSAQSGKSDLLAGSGLNFPRKYPSEADGLAVEGMPQMTWFFGNEAVWIDTPATYMEESHADDWRATISSLAHIRTDKPVDGLAMVISAADVLNAESRQVKEQASALRARIDELIAAWQIEFPVYIIFSRMDEVPGFKEFFSNAAGKWGEQIFGATLSGEQQRVLPRLAFSEEFQVLSDSLADFRLNNLALERDAARKRLMCRFVIHFDGMKEKLAEFVTELFKPSSYEGKPIFRGFYFASCQTVTEQESVAATVQSIDVSQTILNHPLNPRRAAANAPASGKSPPAKQIKRAYFVAPLFNRVMVADKSLVKRTQKGKRQAVLHYWSVAAIILVVMLAIGSAMAISALRTQQLLTEVSEQIRLARGQGRSLSDEYRTLGKINAVVARLQAYKDQGVPLSMRFGFYRGNAVLDKLKADYFTLINRLLVGPSVFFFEYRIKERCEAYGELTGEGYNDLYTNLKAYLSISEAAARSKEIDTLFLRPMIMDAVTRYVVAKEQAPRLPAEIEMIVQQTIGLYLHYVKQGEFPKTQENQSVVASARDRLRRLPDAKTLYENVASRLKAEAPTITLDQILNRKEEGILKTDRTISTIYTQEGWDNSVAEEIAKASKNPFTLDWVIGLTSDNVPEDAQDPKLLQSEMKQVYFEDFRREWLTFLGSVTLDQFGDIPRCSRLLKKLAGDQSEIKQLLSMVADYTVIKEGNAMVEAGGKALDAAGSFKATKKLAAKVEKQEKNVSNLTRLIKKSDEEASGAFDPLRGYVRAGGGGLGGYEAYRDHLSTLIEKLTTIEEKGNGQIIAVFNGSEQDPLLASWKYVNTQLGSWPEELSAAVRNIMLLPVSYTGQAVAVVLSEQINSRWQEEIVKVYTNRFAGRYPFTHGGEEASFQDVMDFFRPTTGTFWGFYDRVLSPYVRKTDQGWRASGVGSVDIIFNAEIAATLQRAEKIRNIFFNPDGTVRFLTLSVSPLSANKYASALDVCGQKYDLPPGGTTVQFRWPIEAPEQGATLKIVVSKDFTQDITFKGNWGFLRLVEAANVNVLSPMTFNAKWQVNVQNMYVIFITHRIQVSSADHPFNEPVFKGFSCPTSLAGVKSNPAPAEGGE